MFALGGGGPVSETVPPPDQVAQSILPSAGPHIATTYSGLIGSITFVGANPNITSTTLSEPDAALVTKTPHATIPNVVLISLTAPHAAGTINFSISATNTAGASAAFPWPIIVDAPAGQVAQSISPAAPTIDANDFGIIGAITFNGQVPASSITSVTLSGADAGLFTASAVISGNAVEITLTAPHAAGTLDLRITGTNATGTSAVFLWPVTVTAIATQAATAISPTSFTASVDDSGVILSFTASGGIPDGPYTFGSLAGADAALFSLASNGNLTLTAPSAVDTLNITVVATNAHGASAPLAAQILIVDPSAAVFDTPDPPSYPSVDVSGAFPLTITASTIGSIPVSTAYANWTALANALRAYSVANSDSGVRVNVPSGVTWPVSSCDFPLALVAPKNADKTPTAFVNISGSGNGFKTLNTLTSADDICHIEGFTIGPDPAILAQDNTATTGPRYRTGNDCIFHEGNNELRIVSCHLRNSNFNGLYADTISNLTATTAALKVFDTRIAFCGNFSDTVHNIYVHRQIPFWFIRSVSENVAGGHCLKAEGYKIVVLDSVIIRDSGKLDNIATATITATSGPQNVPLNGFDASGGSVNLVTPQLVRVTCKGNLSGRDFTITGTSDGSTPLSDVIAVGKNNAPVYTTKRFQTITAISVGLIGSVVTGTTIYVGIGIANPCSSQAVTDMSRCQDIRVARTVYGNRAIVPGGGRVIGLAARSDAFGGRHPFKQPSVMNSERTINNLTPWLSDGYTGAPSQTTFCGHSAANYAASATDIKIDHLKRAGSGTATATPVPGTAYDVAIARLDGTVLDVDDAIPINATFTADATTNRITYSGLTGLSGTIPDGAAVKLTNSGGALPSPLLATSQYYFGQTAAGVGGIATSAANALADTFIDLTTAGTGTHKIHLIGLSIVYFPLGGALGGTGARVDGKIAIKLASQPWDTLDLNSRFYNRNDPAYFWGKNTTYGCRDAAGALDLTKQHNFTPHYFEDVMFCVDATVSRDLFDDATIWQHMWWGDNGFTPELPLPPCNHPTNAWADVAGAANFDRPLQQANYPCYGTTPSGFVDRDNMGSVCDFVWPWPTFFRNMGYSLSSRTTAAFSQFTHFHDEPDDQYPELVHLNPDIRWVNGAGAMVPVTAADANPHPDSAYTMVVGNHAEAATKIYLTSTSGFSAGKRIHIALLPPMPGYVHLHASTCNSVGSDGGGPFMVIADGLPRSTLTRSEVAAFDPSGTPPATWIYPDSYGSQ